MIEQITSCKETYGCILVEESVKNANSGVLRCIVRGLLEKYDRVVCVCLSSTPSDFAASFSTEKQSKLVCIDLFSDVDGWRETGCNLSQFLSNPKSSLTNFSSKVAVVIDSLSDIVLYRNVSTACRLIRRLLSSKESPKIETVVGRVLTELHRSDDDEVVEKLRYYANVIVSIEKMPVGSKVVTTVEQKLSSGKVTRKRELSKVSTDWQVYDVEDLIVSSKPKEKLDPTANLTFKLSLTDSEKEARSRVVLPYVHHHLRPESDSRASTASGGKIFYQPDEADDFDEEDPDDDLDI